MTGLRSRFYFKIYFDRFRAFLYCGCSGLKVNFGDRIYYAAKGVTIS